MDDAGAVGHFERIRDLARDPSASSTARGPARCGRRVWGPPRVPSRGHDAVCPLEAIDVAMLEWLSEASTSASRWASEALTVAYKRRRQDLQGHRSFEVGIGRPIHSPIPPCPISAATSSRPRGGFQGSALAGDGL